MTRAAIYARFSSEKQREESIEDQVRVCREYARREGYDVAATYADEARSGTSAERRPGFQRMVRDAERAGWDAVIVYKMDRFARNRFDSATYKARLKRYGTRLVSATEGIPEGPEGIILDSVLEGMAEYYSANLSQNVLRGMEGNALRCMHNGVEVYGYGLGPDGRYVVDESQAPAVRDAFARIAAGESRAAVADSLNTAGYRTIRGKPWKVDAVARMIRNEKYTGVYIWGDVRIEGGMPAIVDSATYAAANERLSNAPRRRRGKSAPYLLSGLIFDADGNRMEPDCGRSRTGDYHYYYRSRVSRVSIRRDEAEARVRRAVADLINGSPEIAEPIVDAVMAEQELAMGAELAAIRSMRARISEIEREQARVVDAIAIGALRPEHIGSRMTDLDAEREALEAEAADAERGAPVIEPDMVRYMLHRLSECDGPDAVVRGFVSRVVVSADGGIWVGFTVNPDGGPPDGKALVRVDSHLGSHCELTRTPHVIAVRGGFFLSC